MNEADIKRIETHLKRTFVNGGIHLKDRPKQKDSAEVYIGDEFLGIVFRDEDEGDYNFSMAILDVDLA